MEGFQRWTSPWLLCLMLLSSVLYLRVCTLCMRECGKQRGNSSPENYSEQPAVSESHHRNLSTSIILAPTSYGATNISLKRIITQLSHPHLWELAAYEGYFWVFNPLNAEMNYPCISVLLGRRGCLIHFNIWMIAIHCDSNYEACTHPQKHPIQSNWQLKCS